MTSAAPRARETRPAVVPWPLVLAGLFGVASAGLTAALVLFYLGIYQWGGNPFPWWGWPLLLVPPAQLWAAVRLLRRGGRWALVLASLPGVAIWLYHVAGAVLGGMADSVVVMTGLPVVIVVLASLPTARAAGRPGVPAAVVLAVVLAMLGAAAPIVMALGAVGLLGQVAATGVPGSSVGEALLTVAVATLPVVAAARVYRGSSGVLALACSGILTGVHTVAATPGGDWSWRGLLLTVSLSAAAAALLPAVRAWTRSRPSQVSRSLV